MIRSAASHTPYYRKDNALSSANRSLLAARLQYQHVYVRGSNLPIVSIGPSETDRVLWAELNTTLSFTKH
jgi:hypothetical protein